jgi:hypothetical protein
MTLLSRESLLDIRYIIGHLKHPVFQRFPRDSGTLSIMVASPEDIERVNIRARQIGAVIGWSLYLTASPDQPFVALTADTFDDDLKQHHIVVWGPKTAAEFDIRDVEKFLDDLEQGTRRIVVDEKGDPRIN